VRGGGEAWKELERDAEQPQRTWSGRQVKFMVTTTAGSKYVDKKLEVSAALDMTVGDLKKIIQVSPWYNPVLAGQHTSLDASPCPP
jgi:hypothetical protein